MKLLIATHNAGKLREYRALCRTLPGVSALEITGLSEEGIELEPEETGRTFEENAILKAKVFAEQSGLPTLADDSGLEIDALGGAPGVHSARYGGTGRGQDARRIVLVLDHLKDVSEPRRTARFRCVIAVAMPGGTVKTASGAVEGLIAQEPHGEQGFGYDPVFFLPEFKCTMAELDPATKNRISHRAQAMQAALPILEWLLSAQPAVHPGAHDTQNYGDDRPAGAPD
jgi:XTP/dITP diphosphohydrolase